MLSKSWDDWSIWWKIFTSTTHVCCWDSGRPQPGDRPGLDLADGRWWMQTSRGQFEGAVQRVSSHSTLRNSFWARIKHPNEIICRKRPDRSISCDESLGSSYNNDVTNLSRDVLVGARKYENPSHLRKMPIVNLYLSTSLMEHSLSFPEYVIYHLNTSGNAPHSQISNKAPVLVKDSPSDISRAGNSLINGTHALVTFSKISDSSTHWTQI